MGRHIFLTRKPKFPNKENFSVVFQFLILGTYSEHLLTGATFFGRFSDNHRCYSRDYYHLPASKNVLDISARITKDARASLRQLEAIPLC